MTPPLLVALLIMGILIGAFVYSQVIPNECPRCEHCQKIRWLRGE